LRLADFITRLQY
jgi:hypothetical protein